MLTTYSITVNKGQVIFILEEHSRGIRLIRMSYNTAEKLANT